MLNKIGNIGKKIKNYLGENKRLNAEAAKEMDKRYPAGWSQNEGRMIEVSKIKKQLKKK